MMGKANRKMNKNKKKATSGSKGKKIAKKTPKKVVKVQRYAFCLFPTSLIIHIKQTN